MAPATHEREALSMRLFVIGLNFRSAPVEIREKLSVTAEEIPALIRELKSDYHLHEVAVLSTCNRFEIYGVSEGCEIGAAELLNAILQRNGHGPLDSCFSDRIYLHEGFACVRHLFRVASSLDSLVVGETEIVGQVKRAYQISQAAAGAGKWLNLLFQNALSVSKQARTRSGIGRCATSVGSIALELARKIFGDTLRSQSILVLGAGKMSETVVRHLTEKGRGAIIVINRTFERAAELASRFNAQAVAFEHLSEALANADIIISSTSSPSYLISKGSLEAVMAQRKHRPLLCIDLAVPRDVDPRVAEIEGVYAANIDELAQLARENLQKRRNEAALCEKLVTEQAEKMAQRLFGAEQPPARRLPIRGESTPAAFPVPFARVVLSGINGSFAPSV